jgi:hypothetical protein
VSGDPGIRSGCIKGRQHAPSADNAARATAEQPFDSLRSRRSSSRQSFGGAPSAVDGPHINKRAAAAAAAGGKSKVPKPSIVQKALAAAANRPAARKRAVRERTSLGGDAGESGSDGSGAQPPAQRRRSTGAAAASSGAGPSSPAATRSSLPDELSGDEFDEAAEAAFHDSPNRMEHDRRADFADRDEDGEVEAALDALRARVDDGSDWASSLDANSPRREAPQQPQQQPQPQHPDDDDDDDWAHLEVGSGELADAHPPYPELVTQDVCVMEAAFAPDFKLTTRSAIGWRGQVSAPWLALHHALL